MKNLKTISDSELHSETMTAAGNEKSATLSLLVHLAEIDARKLFASMGYASLWEYTHKVLQYSESQSSERVNSMRLMVRVPEVKKEIEAGRLNLTTTAKLATHVNREKSSTEETLDLLAAIKGKTTREVERVLVSDSTETARPDQIKPITAETTRITMDVDSEFIYLLERVKELRGHVGSKPQELLKTTLLEFVKRREVKPVKEKPSKINPGVDLKLSLRAQKVFLTPVQRKPGEENKKRSRYIWTEIKNFIRVRSGDQCEFVDFRTKRRCESKTSLEYEHVRPFSAGGESTIQNLKHYCRTHNQLAAVRYFGKNKMERFSKCS